MQFVNFTKIMSKNTSAAEKQAAFAVKTLSWRSPSNTKHVLNFENLNYTIKKSSIY